MFCSLNYLLSECQTLTETTIGLLFYDPATTHRQNIALALNKKQNLLELFNRNYHFVFS